MILGMTPEPPSPWTPALPSIVNVFPVPVWPYAKTVELNPLRTASTVFVNSPFSYTASCVVPPSNTVSKQNSLVFPCFVLSLMTPESAST